MLLFFTGQLFLLNNSWLSCPKHGLSSKIVLDSSTGSCSWTIYYYHLTKYLRCSIHVYELQLWWGKNVDKFITYENRKVFSECSNTDSWVWISGADMSGRIWQSSTEVQVVFACYVLSWAWYSAERSNKWKISYQKCNLTFVQRAACTRASKGLSGLSRLLDNSDTFGRIS